MIHRVSLAQLLQLGPIEPIEAIALVQQLIHGRKSLEPGAGLRPPFGPPSLENVFAAADGTVTCDGSDATFAVSEIGTLLQELLPAGTLGVPGGLRYTIARACLEVDVPPFDSLDELSHALARHERGVREEVVSNVVRRSLLRDRHDRQTTVREFEDRRRCDPMAVAELRRHLRDADARVYDQQRAIDALGALVKPQAPSRRASVIAAGFIAGLMLIGAGQLMRTRPEPAAQASAAVVTKADTAIPEVPRPPRAIAAPAVPAASGIPVAQRTRGTDDAPILKSITQTRAPSLRDRTSDRTSGDRTSGKTRRFRWIRRIVVRADPL